jgi:creatinine amidohydrolase
MGNDSVGLLHLENMTYEELEEEVAKGIPLLLPIGAIEQHGPHMPLGTDTFIHVEIARKLAEKRRFLLAPPIWFSAYSRPLSGGGRTFVGTIGVSGRSMQSYFRDLAADLFRQGFRRLIVLNGHMENAAFVAEALEEAVAPYRETHKAIMISWAYQITEQELDQIFPDGFPGWEVEHAGVVETSLMEALLPELVRVELKIDGGPERYPTYDIFPPPPDTVAPHGLLCKSTPASAEIGEFVAGLVVERFAAIFDKEFPS